MKLLPFPILLLTVTVLSASLAACAAPAPTATSTATSASTETPIPLPPTATATPNALESGQGQALLGLGYEQAQLQEYTSFAEGEYSFPGDIVTYHGIIGTKADGSKEMMAIKFSDNPNYLKLSSTEIMELSKQLPVKNFIEGYSSGGEKTYLMVISTGIVEDIAIKNQANAIVGQAQVLLGITNDKNGHPRLVQAPIQMETVDKPNVDILIWNIGFYSKGSMKSDKIYSSDELKLIVPKGSLYRYGIPKDGPKESNIGGKFFIDYIYSDPNYKIADFLSSEGVLAPEQKPLLLFTLSLGT